MEICDIKHIQGNPRQSDIILMNNIVITAMFPGKPRLVIYLRYMLQKNNYIMFYLGREPSRMVSGYWSSFGSAIRII